MPPVILENYRKLSKVKMKMKNNVELVLGADIGTNGIKVELFDLSGKCLASSFRKSKLIRSGADNIEENPEFQLSNLCSAIKDCMKSSHRSSSDVAAIGIDGQMAGVIGIGLDGLCVTPYDSWLDTRCTPFIAEMNKKAGSEILFKTGCAPAVNHGPKILWWKKTHPAIFRKIKSFMQPGGYAAMRLCGLKATDAFIDTTYLHFSGFADNVKESWDASLCKTFGIDLEILPKIVKPEKIIGGLTKAMAARCGLDEGIPVVAGCGDTAASFLSCGAVSDGICVDVAGTASVFAATTSKFKPDSENGILACGQAVTPGLWHSYAYINGGGMNLNWFRDEIASLGHPLPKGTDFENLDRQASKIKPGQDSPLFIPHLGGRVCPAQPAMRGAWLNLSWNCNASHLYRSVLEGVALEYKIYAQTLGQLLPHFSLCELRITGGGEKSTLWNQIKADATGIPVVQIHEGHGAPLGSAILAAWGAELIGNPREAAQKWIKLSKRFKPDKKMASYYSGRLEKYRKTLNFLKEKL